MDVTGRTPARDGSTSIAGTGTARAKLATKTQSEMQTGLSSGLVRFIFTVENCSSVPFLSHA